MIHMYVFNTRLPLRKIVCCWSRYLLLYSMTQVWSDSISSEWTVATQFSHQLTSAQPAGARRNAKLWGWQPAPRKLWWQWKQGQWWWEERHAGQGCPVDADSIHVYCHHFSPLPRQQPTWSELPVHFLLAFPIKACYSGSSVSISCPQCVLCCAHWPCLPSPHL